VPAKFKLVNGVRIYADGREVCKSPSAWKRRRVEVLRLAGFRCQCREDCAWHRGRRCGASLRKWAEIHHKKRRGLGGGRRDDRKENLEADCLQCHQFGENK